MNSSRGPRRIRRAPVYFAFCLLILVLLPIHGASGQNYIEYKVQINSDGSAVWIITQFSSINGTIDSWEGFQEKIFNLVGSAASTTQREMTIDENSPQINTVILSESKTTEYSFKWLNFSIISDDEISFGDAFNAPNFFVQLYGEASLQISYPSAYEIKSITPAPYERDDQAETLRWARTEDLASSDPNITLTKAGLIENGGNNELQTITVIVGVLAAAITLSLIGFYAFKRRNAKNKQTKALMPPVLSAIESEEDKVIKILKASGGSMHQSAITEQCRFSKAKTSQLLSVLEKKGIVARYKKGRDKIVTLKERVKG